MKFQVVFTLVDFNDDRRTALVLADSKGQARRVLTQSLELDDLENISGIEFQRMDSIDTMTRTNSATVLSVIY